MDFISLYLQVIQVVKYSYEIYTFSEKAFVSFILVFIFQRLWDNKVL